MPALLVIGGLSRLRRERRCWLQQREPDSKQQHNRHQRTEKQHGRLPYHRDRPPRRACREHVMTAAMPMLRLNPCRRRFRSSGPGRPRSRAGPFSIHHVFLLCLHAPFTRRQLRRKTRYPPPPSAFFQGVGINFFQIFRFCVLGLGERARLRPPTKRLFWLRIASPNFTKNRSQRQVFARSTAARRGFLSDGALSYDKMSPRAAGFLLNVLESLARNSEIAVVGRGDRGRPLRERSPAGSPKGVSEGPTGA